MSRSRRINSEGARRKLFLMIRVYPDPSGSEKTFDTFPVHSIHGSDQFFITYRLIYALSCVPNKGKPETSKTNCQASDAGDSWCGA